jgi:hypothetical protein
MSFIKYISLICALVTAISPLQAAEIGRLFSSPSERAQLDYLRRTSKPVTTDQQAAPDETAVMSLDLPEQISIQGYVKRSDGKKGTVWVNHQPIQENTDSGSITIGSVPKNGNQVPVKIPAAGKLLNLKAGQAYSMDTDSVSEVRAEAYESDADTID